MPKSIVWKSFVAGVAALLLSQPGAHAADGAMFVTQSVPNAMQLGKTYTVSVTYQNTGNAKWTRGVHRLGTQNPHDNRRWGRDRIELPPGVEVGPGQLHTFVFDVRIDDRRDCRPMSNPVLTGCDFQWGLVQEHVAWLDAGVNTEVLLFDAPPAVTSFSPLAPPVAVASAAFNSANFRGANMLIHTYEDDNQCDHTAWLPDAAGAATIIDKAASMGLTVLRIPVILPPKKPGKPSDWMGNSPAYSRVCANPDRAEWGGEASSAVLTRDVIAKMRVIMDLADAAQLKVIPILDGYTKYNQDCYWKKSYLDVKDSAAAFITAFKSHPALLAWDVMNEPLWNAIAFDCVHASTDYASVVDAVHAMYNLVRSLDAAHPTTVGEHQVPLLKYWKDILSFASPHLYIHANSGDPGTLNQINYVQSATMREMSRELGAAMPLVIGEFGSTDADDQFNASYEQRYLDGLTIEDRGFMLWSLSTGERQQGYSVMRPNGELKPAALVVQRRQWYPVIQRLYLGYMGYPADPAALANFSAALVDLAQDMRSRSLVLERSVTALNQAYPTEPALRALIDGLHHSGEAVTAYTPDQVPAYVNQIYLRLFNRRPDADGLRFWSDSIDYFGLEKSRAVLAVIASSLDNTSPQGAADAAIGNKKAAIAANFSASLNTPRRQACYSGNHAVDAGRALLAAVGGQTSVQAYQAEIDASLVRLCGL